nr:hypothetical protein [Arachidicoccus sp. BS20]
MLKLFQHQMPWFVGTRTINKQLVVMCLLFPPLFGICNPEPAVHDLQPRTRPCRYNPVKLQVINTILNTRCTPQGISPITPAQGQGICPNTRAIARMIYNVNKNINIQDSIKPFRTVVLYNSIAAVTISVKGNTMDIGTIDHSGNGCFLNAVRNTP